MSSDSLGWKRVYEQGVKRRGEIEQLMNSAVKPPFPSIRGIPRVLKAEEFMMG